MLNYCHDTLYTGFIMSMYDTSVLTSGHEHCIMKNAYSNVVMNLTHLHGLNKTGVHCNVNDENDHCINI